LGTSTFVTDSEFEALFGPQVVAATAILSRYAEKICRACGGECCHRIGCEFYSVGFGFCPIYEYRPAKCRVCYCEKVLENDPSQREGLTREERELLSKPAENLSEVLRHLWGVKLFLEPPLSLGEPFQGKGWLAGLGVEDEVRQIVQAFEKAEIEGGPAIAALVGLVQQCRGEGRGAVEHG